MQLWQARKVRRLRAVSVAVGMEARARWGDQAVLVVLAAPEALEE